MPPKNKPSIQINRIPVGYSNVYVLSNKNTLLIDTGLPSTYTLLETKLKALDALNQLDAVVITHGHLDHLGAAHEIRKNTPAQFVIHKEDAHVLQTAQQMPIKSRGCVGKALKLFISLNEFVNKRLNKHQMQPVEPDILVQHEDTLDAIGFPELQVIHTPGHTPGSICVYLPGAAIFVGDLIHSSLGNPDKPTLPRFYQDINQSKASIQQLLAYDWDIAYPGHGNPFPRAEIEKFIHTL